MLIDIVLAILLVMAVIKGLQRGLVVAIFSLLGLIVGIAAALKLSVWVALYLEDNSRLPSKWLPIISFLLVFIAVVLLVRLVANLVQSSLELAWLGWANKIGGMFLYVIMYSLAFSVLIFFAAQAKLINENSIRESVSYQYIAPWGPLVIDGIGSFIPVFKNMFTELENFFEKLAQNGSQ
jgi:membrane protein required for colicin V production